MDNALVEEVLEFARSGRLLHPPSLPSPTSLESYIVLHDFDRAIDYSRLTGWEAGYQDEDGEDDEGEDYLTWLGIRSREANEVHKVAYRHPQVWSVKAYPSWIARELGKAIDEHLPPSYRAAINDIEGDLDNIARSRAYGAQNPFFERLFTLYQAGLWPCGWEGIYPEGQMVVFYPSTAD